MFCLSLNRGVVELMDLLFTKMVARKWMHMFGISDVGICILNLSNVMYVFILCLRDNLKRSSWGYGTLKCP